jgi:hypothetical protein
MSDRRRMVQRALVLAIVLLLSFGPIALLHVSTAVNPVPGGTPTGTAPVGALASSPSVAGSSQALGIATPGPIRPVDRSPTSSIAVVSYNVTFSEIGLPPGTAWWVNATGQPSVESQSGSVVVSWPNDTYQLTFATANKTYDATPPTASWVVDGKPTSDPVMFSLVTFLVHISEQGLPTYTIWSIACDGALNSSPTDEITVREPNGSFVFAVTPLSGFSANPTNISVRVDGANTNGSSVKFTSQTASSSSDLPSFSGLEIALIVVIVAAVIVEVVLVARSRKPPPPPERWESSPPAS